MTTYIAINGNQYPAVITSKTVDKDWNNRASKTIKLQMLYNDVSTMFVDDVEWSIVEEFEVIDTIVDEDDNVFVTTKTEFKSYDNSEYCISGDIIDHRDGTVTVKMGKPTTEELLAVLIGG